MVIIYSGEYQFKNYCHVSMTQINNKSCSYASTFLQLGGFSHLFLSKKAFTLQATQRWSLIHECSSCADPGIFVRGGSGQSDKKKSDVFFFFFF